MKHHAILNFAKSNQSLAGKHSPNAEEKYDFSEMQLSVVRIPRATNETNLMKHFQNALKSQQLESGKILIQKKCR